jgi:hypothetical protein
MSVVLDTTQFHTPDLQAFLFLWTQYSLLIIAEPCYIDLVPFLTYWKRIFYSLHIHWTLQPKPCSDRCVSGPRLGGDLACLGEPSRRLGWLGTTNQQVHQVFESVTYNQITTSHLSFSSLL